MMTVFDKCSLTMKILEYVLAKLGVDTAERTSWLKNKQFLSTDNKQITGEIFRTEVAESQRKRFLTVQSRTSVRRTLSSFFWSLAASCSSSRRARLSFSSSALSAWNLSGSSQVLRTTGEVPRGERIESLSAWNLVNMNASI